MTLADVAGMPVVEEAVDPLPVAVPWLWPGRVPIGRPTVLLGGLDHGKSLVALNLAARVSAGGEWLDGRGRAPKGKVILMSREDNLRDTVRPRLDLAGADPEMIAILDKVKRFYGSAEILFFAACDDFPRGRQNRSKEDGTTETTEDPQRKRRREMEKSWCSITQPLYHQSPQPAAVPLTTGGRAGI